MKTSDYFAVRKEMNAAVVELCESAKAKNIPPIVFTSIMISILITFLRACSTKRSESFLRDALVDATNLALEEQALINPRRKRKKRGLK